MGKIMNDTNFIHQFSDNEILLLAMIDTFEIYFFGNLFRGFNLARNTWPKQRSGVRGISSSPSQDFQQRANLITTGKVFINK